MPYPILDDSVLDTWDMQKGRNVPHYYVGIQNIFTIAYVIFQLFIVLLTGVVHCNPKILTHIRFFVTNYPSIQGPYIVTRS